MQFEMKKIIRYAVILLLGMNLVVYGLIDMTLSRYMPESMSDAEIMERARDLGMVSIKDEWINMNKAAENQD